MYRFGRVIFANYRRFNNLKNHIEFSTNKFNIKSPIKLISAASIFSYFGSSKTSEELAENEESELIMTMKRGILSVMRSEYDKAEQLYHLALRNAQSVNNEAAVTYIYDLLANLALEVGQFPKAEKLFVSVMQRLMDKDKALEDDIRILHISSKIAHIAYLQENYEKAMLGYQFVLEKIQARDYLKEENYHELYGIVKNLIGQAYIAMKNYPEAKKALQEAHTVFKKYKDEMTDDGVILLNNLSCVSAELKEYDSSLQYLNEAIKIAQKIKIEDLSPYHINLGMLYFKQKLLEKARSSCSLGWKMATKYENKEAIKAANHCLEQVKKATS